jgi:hypothetical protein
MRTLLICAVALTQLTLGADVDWLRFLERHDLTWRWNSSEATWPSVYQLAAFTGNGLYGVTAMVDSGGQSLRFDVARTDVYDCGLMPRMSIGSARIGFSGAIVNGTMRQSLHRGTLSGTLQTSQGGVSWYAYVPAEPGEYSPQQPRAIVVVWTATGAEEPRAWFAPFTQLGNQSSSQDSPHHAQGRPFPPVHCTSAGTGESVCRQSLACGSYSTALKVEQATTVESSSSSSDSLLGDSGGESWRMTIGIGNQQQVQQYPTYAAECMNSSAEALEAARAAMSLPEARLRSDHERWWAEHWANGSMISVPDTRLESFYAIQTYKLGAAYRPTGIPVIDQQGPFKADCAGQWDGTNQTDGKCSGWRGLWFDYNVEMNYYMQMKANRPELIGSLKIPFTRPEGLAALKANGLTMAYNHSNASWEGAMGVSCGEGLSLKHLLSEGHSTGSQGTGWAGCHPSALNPEGKPYKPGECISENLLHVVYLIARECVYTAGDRGECMRNVLPLLYGGLKVMQLHSTTDPLTGTIHVMPSHMSDYPGLLKNFTLGSSGPDASQNVEQYRWACATVVDASRLRGVTVRADMLTLCHTVLANLTNSHVDPGQENGAPGALVRKRLSIFPSFD